MDLTIVIAVALLAALGVMSWLLVVGVHRHPTPPLTTGDASCEYCGHYLGSRAHHTGLSLRGLYWCDEQCYSGGQRRARREAAMKRGVSYHG